VTDVRLVETKDLSDTDRRAIRSLLDEAFDGGFSDDDWRHALGGWHAVAGAQGSVVGHGAVIERRILVGPRTFRAGYVEAVAVKPACRRAGLGSAITRRLTEVVRSRFELGALSTGEWRFYERLGWERWLGPTWVRAADGRFIRSEQEDDGVMVLRCAASQHVDRGASIVCDERTGDSW
jgi:aminoglycoside 2'-N-acetyltransferase I